MPGLVPGIHILFLPVDKTWMAGASPAMTTKESQTQQICNRISFPDSPAGAGVLRDAEKTMDDLVKSASRAGV